MSFWFVLRTHMDSQFLVLCPRWHGLWGLISVLYHSMSWMRLVPGWGQRWYSCGMFSRLAQPLSDSSGM